MQYSVNILGIIIISLTGLILLLRDMFFSHEKMIKNNK